MTDRGVELDYETFRDEVGSSLDDWAEAHHYSLVASDGLTLKADWHVAYYRSRFDGKACLYLVWSAFEHIWVSEGFR
jgi:hypothetical protein